MRTFLVFLAMLACAPGRLAFLQRCEVKNMARRVSIFIAVRNGTCRWFTWWGLTYCSKYHWQDLFELEYECDDSHWVLEDSKGVELPIYSSDANKRLCEQTQCCGCKEYGGRSHATPDRQLMGCELYVHKSCKIEISRPFPTPSNDTQGAAQPSIPEETRIVEAIINTTNSNTAEEVAINLDAIEKDLRAIALLPNASQTTQRGLGFVVASAPPANQTADGVYLSVGETQVRLKSGTNGSTLYAAQIYLPENAMMLLIPEEARSAPQFGNKHRITALLHDTPFVSAGGVLPQGGKANFSAASINFTFTLDPKDEDEDSENDEMFSGPPARQRPFHFGREVVTQARPVCSFVDPGRAVFSQVGCRHVLSEDGRNLTCSCNHTTMFAVLLTMSVIEIPPGVQILSFVTESVSVVCLILAITVLSSLRRSIKSDRTSVQINLCLALLFLHVALLFQEPAVRNCRTCEFVTVAIHYFLLASGAWMGVEGLFLLMVTSDRTLQLHARKRQILRKLKYLVGWGVPGLIVAIATVVGFVTDSYMEESEAHAGYIVHPRPPKYNFCWLSTRSAVRAPALLVPLALSLAFNLAVALKVSFFVARKREEQRNYAPSNQQCCAPPAFGKFSLDEVAAGVKALFVLIPALGIPWMLAYVAGSEDTLASEIFMYLNALITGLQGLMLLLVYCVYNATVWQLIKRRYKACCMK